MRIMNQAAAPLCYTGAIEYTTDNRDDVRVEEDFVTGGIEGKYVGTRQQARFARA